MHRYSFAICMWEIISQKKPYTAIDGVAPMEIAYHVAENGLRPIMPDSCPEGLATLTIQCWDANPKTRPNFSAVRTI